MKKWIPLLLATLVVISCKTKKNAMQNASENDSIIVENSDSKNPIDAGKNISDRLSFYENIYIHPKFENIKISSKITADNIRVSPLDATIYIESDKKIWSNINFLFFNAARAIITPEGIKAVDKYNKNYIDSDFEYLNNLLNINFIDYKTLEKILTGRTFLAVSDRNSRITKNMEGYQLASIVNQKIVTNDLEREYKINMRYSNDYDLIYVKLQDVKTDDAVEIVYDQWESFENNLRLPQSVKIIIKGSKTSQILLENTKFGFNKMETPYSVPANYKKIEIK
ncbi:hypothetical protein CHRY9390_00977 [Chryseobacterium aquaeductus]|uniref:DUF4292 domain-containing protein n=1 Tax=Chryseobacterium aquaeductus TaxID=2675056 RepID=A0A9N8MF15_9FLAO|nr:DUF4292 domain-containing protein [Chryseobacterium aquaeductus]CAA7330315.1 hypothetical protein CHRY9390_00977 [Chryseobacterium potabilaquae]CAD7802777.1 hypothetical protein CHRY9390_00977 [Chryseobacterium aquaeductus]